MSLTIPRPGALPGVAGWPAGLPFMLEVHFLLFTPRLKSRAFLNYLTDWHTTSFPPSGYLQSSAWHLRGWLYMCEDSLQGFMGIFPSSFLAWSLGSGARLLAFESWLPFTPCVVLGKVPTGMSAFQFVMCKIGIIPVGIKWVNICMALGTVSGIW